MATTVLKSETESDNSELFAGDAIQDIQPVEVELAINTTLSDKEDVLVNISNVNTPEKELACAADAMNSESPDLNPETNSTQLSETGKGLRKFLSSAKQRFDNVEPGWAQRKTTSKVERS